MNNPDLQGSIAAAAREVRIKLGPIHLELVRIPAGIFEIGSNAQETGHQADESPVRKVRISSPFYLGRYEITQAQYQAVMGAVPSRFRGDKLAQDEVIFANALEFCRRLSKMTDIVIELPTEAQWEYAARAGTRTPFYSGVSSADLDKIAWYSQNSGGTVHEVGLKQPNAFGLFDMIGNVWELTADFLGAYSDIPDRDPVGELNRRGALRGGGWDTRPEDTRAARRMLSDPMFGGSGFRIAINPSPSTVSR